MQPTIAIVGRPNVGKSTLFNRLTGTRNALVADVPGLTRDRLYADASLGDRVCTLVDTGGLGAREDELGARVEEQAWTAIEDSDLVLFLVDGRDGVTAADQEIAAQLRRRSARRVLLAANKMDAVSRDHEWPSREADFLRLGFGEPVGISAAHGQGIGDLREQLAAGLPPAEPESIAPIDEDRIRLAVIGRPNVGKSTLVNRWLGESRQLVSDLPGTTRDSVAIPFERDDDRFVLIDTAGVRRRGRLVDVVEKFSVVKALEALRTSDVAVLLIDAREGLVEQDVHLLGYGIDAGVGLVVGVNKWDGLDVEQRGETLRSLERGLAFAPWVPVRRLSALHGTGVGEVLDAVIDVHRARSFDVPTSELTRILNEAVEAHAPPAVRGRRIKLRFAHKGGAAPPRIVIHGNQTESVPASYTRYLENRFREVLQLVGTPVRIEYRTGENPFAGRRNELSPRQRERRRRVIRHRKSRES